MLRAIDPSRGEVVREVAPDDDATVDAKLEAARRAFTRWRALSFDERAAVLRIVAKTLRAEVDTLAPLRSLGAGSTGGSRGQRDGSRRSRVSRRFRSRREAVSGWN